MLNEMPDNAGPVLNLLCFALQVKQRVVSGIASRRSRGIGFSQQSQEP